MIDGGPGGSRAVRGATLRRRMGDHDEAQRLEGLWGGEFGDSYVDRNLDTVEGRDPFWTDLLARLDVTNALEVGVNIGPNQYWLATHLGAENTAGVEINPKALEMARERVPGADLRLAPARELPFDDSSFDLVFTTGVLIHQPDDEIDAVMGEIHRASRRYIMAGEYFAEQREEVPYHGQSGALWRDDFGGRYQRLFPDLELIDEKFIAWADGNVWDDMTFWTFEKKS